MIAAHQQRVATESGTLNSLEKHASDKVASIRRCHWVRGRGKAPRSMPGVSSCNLRAIRRSRESFALGGCTHSSNINSSTEMSFDIFQDSIEPRPCPILVSPEGESRFQCGMSAALLKEFLLGG